MHQLVDPVRVHRGYFAGAIRQLEEAGELRRVGAGIWGCDFVSVKTGATVARYTDLRNDGVLCLVERSVFAAVTVRGHTSRYLSGTEYEMLCRKLEAHRRGDRRAAEDIQLPPWTAGLFEQALSEGIPSFRGRSALVTIPFTLSFEQARLDHGLREPAGRAARPAAQG